MKTTCSGKWGCGKTWGGLRSSHCTICHQSFSGDTLGDAHKRLSTPCLTADEMREKGWRLVDDVWRGPEMSDEQLAKRLGGAA
jgi:hypothetical protein